MSSADPRRTVLLVAAGVAAIDVTSKSLAIALLDTGDRLFGPVRLTLLRNPGGPFGWAPGASPWWFAITVVTLAGAVAGVMRAAGSLRASSVVIAAGSVIGGGVGNLVDRAVRQPGPGRGAVVDWIRIEPYDRVFNLADVALRVGAIVLLVALVRGRQGDAPPARNTTSSGRVLQVDECRPARSPR